MTNYAHIKNKQTIKECDWKGHSFRSQPTLVPRAMDNRTGELSMLVYKREQNQQMIKEYDQKGHCPRLQPTFSTKRNGQKNR